MTNKNRPLEHWETTPEQRRNRLMNDLVKLREDTIRMRDDNFNKTIYVPVFVEMDGAVDALTEAINQLKVIHDESA